ncbi:hypothetical protein MWH25_06625 [Natroniella acetigena]|uniref:hypothetical protein n=1 Tax=Natroniella acetigena TaxID=52004 RepID=UPI00200B2B5E|nr:hypothetical protein [Natroniella acetigena]MCK8827417.1 hypothetical protein [Natroniella acetigena]
MKNIKLCLYGGLHKYLEEEKEQEVNVPDGATIDWLYSDLDLDRNVAKVVLQDGDLIENFSTVIEDDAKIEIYPVFGGG